jgi:hypothetical protein
MTDRGEPLLDARRRELARPASIQVATCTACTAPIDGTPTLAHQVQEFIGGAGIGPARVRVADAGREEFEEAHAGTLAGGSDERQESGRSGKGDH